MPASIYDQAQNTDLNAPLAQAQANTANLKNIFAGQQADTSNFLSKYTNAINSQPTSAMLADKIGKELGIPQLQGNANMLRDTLTNLPGTYSKAVRGFDVNNNQLQRIIGQKTSEIAPAVETTERALSTAQGNLNTQMGYAQADQAKQLLPYQSEQALLADRLARETSGYTSMMQGELDAIIAKMQAGVQLSEAEKSRANQLALAEKQFEYSKQLNEQQAKLSGSSGGASDRYKVIGDGAWLYDTQTGQTIKNPQDFSGGGGGGNEWY